MQMAPRKAGTFVALHIPVSRPVIPTAIIPVKSLPGRDPLQQPMAYGFYAGLKPADLADIVAYLRTVPPLQ
jgi:hypothetical protein